MSIDDDVKQALEICHGDPIAALRMVLTAISFYQEEIEQLRAEQSSGYRRGQLRKPAKKTSA